MCPRTMKDSNSLCSRLAVIFVIGSSATSVASRCNLLSWLQVACALWRALATGPISVVALSYWCTPTTSACGLRAAIL